MASARSPNSIVSHLGLHPMVRRFLSVPVEPYLVPVCLLASLTVNLDPFPSVLGYLLSGGSIAALVAYTILYAGFDRPRNEAFYVLLGGFWAFLAIGAIVNNSWWGGAYVLVIPVSVAGLILVSPTYVHRYRETFALCLVSLASVLSVLGLGLLLAYRLDLLNTPFVGRGVWRLPDLRMSFYMNSNLFGGIMAVGGITAYARYRKGSRAFWMVMPLVGLLLSDAKSSQVGFILAAAYMVTQGRRSLVALGTIAGSVMVGIMAATGSLEHTMIQLQEGRFAMWGETLAAIPDHPYWGLSFAGGGAGIHNSYLSILLNVGIPGGLLYISALGVAGLDGYLNADNEWDRYVVATLGFFYVRMMFEGFTLGGLSFDSVLLAIFVGLAIAPRPSRPWNPGSSEERDNTLTRRSLREDNR